MPTKNAANIADNHENLDYLSFEPLLNLFSSEFLQFNHDTFVISYLSELLESSVLELSEEHNKLHSENKKTENDLFQVMQKEHNNLVTIINHGNNFCKSFDLLNESVNKVQSMMISISEKISNFEASKSRFNKILDKTYLLYKHNEYIRDIFEIPSLIEAFAKNNHYSEAISLIIYAKQLELKYSQIDIVQNLMKQVNYMSEYVQKQLLLRLRGPIKLTEAINTIGCLCRMNRFLEIELCYIFLLCRWNYIEKLISDLGSLEQGQDSGKYLKEYIEIFREHSFNIFSYYTSIFLEEPSLFSENLESISEVSKDNLVKKTLKRKILSNFALFMVSEIKKVLIIYVPCVFDDETKISILNRVFNCGQSLGGIGVDFSLALVNIFGDEWNNIIKNHQKMIKKLDQIT